LGVFLIIAGGTPASYYFFDVFIPLFTFFILFADFGINFMRQGWRLRTIMWGKKNFLLHLFYI